MNKTTPRGKTPNNPNWTQQGMLLEPDYKPKISGKDYKGITPK